MEKLFDITLKNREILFRILEKTSKENLLQIPNGYRNNIFWNIAHVLVTEQLLVYKMSGLDVQVPEGLVEKFKKGTVPDGTATDDEIQLVKDLLLSTTENSHSDYNKGMFKNFKEYTTSANVTLRNVDDALAFNVFHEGLHMGAILNLQKSLSK